MKITRSIKHHINLGNYESVELTAGVEAEVPDDVDSINGAVPRLQEILDRVIARDLEAVKDQVAEDLDFNSYIINWKQ